MSGNSAFITDLLHKPVPGSMRIGQGFLGGKCFRSDDEQG